jgi:acyl-coenzyme A thioesterase PaaI-like protein
MATVELQPVRPVNVLAGGIASTRVGASLSCRGAQVNVSFLAPAADGTVVDYIRAPARPRAPGSASATRLRDDLDL